MCRPEAMLSNGTIGDSASYVTESRALLQEGHERGFTDNVNLLGSDVRSMLDTAEVFLH